MRDAPSEIDGSSSSAPTSASSQPGSGSASVFSSATSGAVDAAMPAFTVAGKPRFSRCGSHSTPGVARDAAAEPSVEASSTTSTRAGFSVWAATAARQSSSRRSPW